MQGLLSCMALAWAAWSFCNSVVHNEPWGNIEVRTAGFLKLVHDYMEYISKTRSRGLLCLSSRMSWVCLRDGWFKVYYDATMLGQNVVGIGAVIRDDQGRVVKVVVDYFEVVWSVRSRRLWLPD